MKNGDLMKFDGVYYRDITPDMTANNAPEPYVVTYSTDKELYQSEGYHLFDGKMIGLWFAGSSGWVKLDMGKPVQADQLYINCTPPTAAAQATSVSASVDDQTYVTLGSGTIPLEGAEHHYAFNNPKAYRYYKIDLSSSGWAHLSGARFLQKADPLMKIQLEKGSAIQLIGLSIPNYINVKDVEWTSDNSSIATVDDKGLVTGTAPGLACITVTAKDGSWSDYVHVQVVEKSEYRISIQIHAGEKCRLTVSEDAGAVFQWTSGNTAAATVDSLGRVTAVAEGVTLITVQNEDESYQDTIYLKVVKK